MAEEEGIDKIIKRAVREALVSKEEKGVLKNVGVLNLKDLTEEELEGLKGIKNAGIVIVPKKFMAKLRAKTENVGVIAPFVEGMRLYCGKSRINADTLKSVEKPMTIMQAGKMWLDVDVTPELIMQKIEDIKNYGKIYVPKQTYGALMSKITENMGKVITLESEEEARKRRIEDLKDELARLQQKEESG